MTPLREGGSLPAIVEADDDGLYVLKFRGAGQGPRALVAELVAGELARAIGLPVPELVFVDLDADLARTEPDPEIQELIRASAGLNLALDYLPGSVGFDPVADRIDAALASEVVWFDAYTSNVDRTARNTNLLMWHRRLWLIDHGACLYFHHGTPAEEFARPRRRPVHAHHGARAARACRGASRRSTPGLRRDVADAVIDDVVGLDAGWLARRRCRDAARRLRRLPARPRPGRAALRGGGDPCATATRMTTP